MSVIVTMLRAAVRGRASSSSISAAVLAYPPLADLQ
jgi:hypothetical protein